MCARGGPPARWAGWAEVGMCARGGPWPGGRAGLRWAHVPEGGPRPGGRDQTTVKALSHHSSLLPSLCSPPPIPLATAPPSPSASPPASSPSPSSALALPTPRSPAPRPHLSGRGQHFCQERLQPQGPLHGALHQPAQADGEPGDGGTACAGAAAGLRPAQSQSGSRQDATVISAGLHDGAHVAECRHNMRTSHLSFTHTCYLPPLRELYRSRKRTSY